jgi:hypothetical protein
METNERHRGIRCAGNRCSEGRAAAFVLVWGEHSSQRRFTVEIVAGQEGSEDDRSGQQSVQATAGIGPRRGASGQSSERVVQPLPRRQHALEQVAVLLDPPLDDVHPATISEKRRVS